MLRPAAALLAMALTAPMMAQDQAGPLATSVEWRSLWRADETIALPIEPEPSTIDVALPGVPTVPGAVACLRFKARLGTEIPAGWNNFLGMRINGQAVDRRTPGGWARVVNRRASFVTTHPRYPEVSVVQERGGLPCLQVFFGPPEPGISDVVMTDLDEGYWYLLIVDDLLRADGPNVLTLVNTALREYWPEDVPEQGLVIEELALVVVPMTDLERIRDSHLVHRQPLDGPALTGDGFTVRLAPGGGLQVEMGGDTWFVESAFSFPQDPAMGRNELPCLAEAAGEPGWSPSRARAGDGLLVQASGAAYELRRTLRLDGARIVVEDTLTGRADNVIGVAVSHSIILPGPPGAARLNGVDTIVQPAGSFAENPTVFAARGETGMGFVAEDNALALQMASRVMDNQMTASAGGIGLSPGETCTLRWALYPGPTDYFDFVNTVRRDWDVNFTIHGPFDFLDIRRLGTPAEREAMRRMIERKGMKLFALVPWFEYYNGWPYDREQFQAMMTEAMAFIREIVPDARCLACVETNLVPVPLSFFGDTIPDDWPLGRDAGGRYGQTTTPEMTALIDASPWRDSCLRDADGNVRLDAWYVQHYADPPALNLMVYPEIGNHRHEQALEQFAWLLDEVGFDGLYIDQFSLAWSNDSTRYTGERWDGRTVRLDAAGRVAEMPGDLGLLSADARREWVQLVLDRGKTVVCNTTAALEQLRDLPAFRFMETQGYDPLAGDGPPAGRTTMAKGHLGSPIALGHNFPADAGADFFMRSLIAHLRYGLLYYCYGTWFPSEGERGGEYGPLPHMFPFTPVELHEGWLLGRERLITCLSGTYRWPDQRPPRVLYFDERGRERPGDATVAPAQGGHDVTVSLRDWWEVAVILPPEG